jgi:hypothetical protein
MLLVGFLSSLTSFELGLDLSGYFLVIVKSRNVIQIVDFFCFVAFAGFLPGPDFTSSSILFSYISRRVDRQTTGGIAPHLAGQANTDDIVPRNHVSVRHFLGGYRCNWFQMHHRPPLCLTQPTTS